MTSSSLSEEEEPLPHEIKNATGNANKKNKHLIFDKAPSVLSNSISILRKLLSTKVILPHLPEQKPLAVAGEYERNLEHLLAAHGESLRIAVSVNLGEGGLCDFINVFAFVHF